MKGIYTIDLVPRIRNTLPQEPVNPKPIESVTEEIKDKTETIKETVKDLIEDAPSTETIKETVGEVANSVKDKLSGLFTSRAVEPVPIKQNPIRAFRNEQPMRTPRMNPLLRRRF